MMANKLTNLVQQFFFSSNRSGIFANQLFYSSQASELLHQRKQENANVPKRTASSESAFNLTVDADSEEPEVINPLEHEDYFGVKKLVSLKDLFAARVYMGHTSGCRSGYMRPYVFGTRLDMDVIDLDQTLPLLHTALNFTAHVAHRGGVILFMTRHRQTIPLVERAAREAGEYAHCRTWRAGTFTNQKNVYGLMTRLPDLIIFFNTLDNVFTDHPAVIEAAKCNIPSVGVVDTSCDPRLICYPVPGNDDTPCAIELYSGAFKRAILLGKEKRREEMEREEEEDEEGGS